MFKFYFLLTTLFILAGTTAQAGPMVYFSNTTGIVQDEDQADVKFGMTLKTVKSLLKQGVKQTSEKGERALSFYFHCLSEDCTVEDGGYISMSFISDRLMGIMIMIKDPKMTLKYLQQTKAMYDGRDPDRYCILENPLFKGKVLGWANGLFTTVTVFTMDRKSGLTAVDFRADKFRFNFDQPDCQH
jgi:hypothetical protein